MPGISRANGPATASTRRAETGLLVMALIWAVNFSVVKIGLGSIEPLAFNALRYPMAALLLAASLAAAGRLGLPGRGDVPRIIGLGVLGHGVYQLAFIHGIALTRAGNAALLLTTSPIYTTFLSGLFRHERITRLAWVGVAGAVGGIALVVGAGPGGFRFGSATVRGDLLILVAAVLWSLYTVGGRGVVRKYGSLPVTTWAIGIGAVIQIAVGAPQLARLEPISPGAWASVAYAGFLGIAVGQLLWYRGVRELGSTRTAVFQNVVPLFALAVAWAWLGEVPTPLQLVGAVVIVGGVTGVRLAMGRAP